MELPVLKSNGEESGRSIELPNEIFSIEPNDHAIYLDVKHYLAKQRQGTHKAKERAEIVGSTKKLKKQKGTGTARAGSIKSPLFKGGGRVFGPRPRDYGFKLNKKVKSLARCSALSYKSRDNSIAVLEDLSFDQPKTKEYLELLKELSLAEKKTLFITPDTNKNLYLSGRNLKNTNVVSVQQLNTYELLHADNLIFLESSLKPITELLNKGDA